MSTFTSPCPQGEDLRFLSHCAGSGDFSLLLDGQILPRYMSPVGQEIAEWVLEKHTQGEEGFPPSYDVLREQWPDLAWPPLPHDRKGLDPAFTGGDVWYSYKTYLCAQMHGHVQILAESRYDDEQYAARCMIIRDASDELKNLQNPTARLERVGADPDKTFELIIGQAGNAQIMDFEMDMTELQDLFAPFTSGLYMFFGRPKHTKSWRIERNAWWHSIVRGLPAVLVDPENARETLLRRIACFQGGLDYGDIRRLVRRYSRKDETLTREDHSMMDNLYETCCQLQEKSQLVILGKNEIDPNTGRIEVDRIFSEAEKIGAKVIFAEQIHKYGSPGLSTQANEFTRIRRATEVLADSPYLVIGSTQEKRKDAPRVFKMPEPHEDWVFGGDGVAQNCSALTHVHRFEIPDGSGQIIIMLTPLLGRDGEPGTVRDAIFVRARFGATYEVLPPDEGRARCEAILLAQKKVRDDAAKAAKDMVDLSQPASTQENRPPRPGSTRAVAAMLRGAK